MTDARPLHILNERERRTLQLRESGLTLQAAGDRIGISRERVRQILHAAEAKLAQHELSERTHNDPGWRQARVDQAIDRHRTCLNAEPTALLLNPADAWLMEGVTIDIDVIYADPPRKGHIATTQHGYPLPIASNIRTGATT